MGRGRISDNIRDSVGECTITKMKLTHKQKVRLARKMRSRKEFVAGVGIFVTSEWTKRFDARRLKEINNQA